ncbi:hypothetical protein OKA04_05305 [Luteolibacter flavescens]|uniref:Uncharacterized protein n=1 Tax=Luteolibacter flavescens TaxID=1859460 RepID=A0ABT3FL11_9BACT|nr:hypothetical protein [Luteolibacter flavescens]MCW1884137.1 hypothetical protein [Luteolibacter flavescens]
MRDKPSFRNNPSYRFRVVVWIMPTCFGYAAAELIILLQRHIPSVENDTWFYGWIFASFIATCCLGMLDRKLIDPRIPTDKIFPPLTAFIILQCLVVPFAVLSVILITRYALLL